MTATSDDNNQILVIARTGSKNNSGDHDEKLTDTTMMMTRARAMATEAMTTNIITDNKWQ